MKNRSNHAGPGAFTLAEMLFALSIMGVAAVLSTRLFRASIKTMESAPQTQAHDASIDRMSFALRRDVWSATSIVLSDDRTIALSEPDSTKIRWQLTDSEAIRSDASGDHRWRTDVPLHAERRDGVLLLSGPPDPMGGRDELHFVTQPVSVAEGSR